MYTTVLEMLFWLFGCFEKLLWEAVLVAKNVYISVTNIVLVVWMLWKGTLAACFFVLVIFVS